MDNARSFFVVLLALLFVFVLWAWASGNAKKLLDAISVAFGGTASAAASTPAIVGGVKNGSALNPPSYTLPAGQLTIPILSVGGSAFSEPPQLITPTQALTLPTIPSLQMPQTSNIGVVPISSHGVNQRFSNVSQIPQSYNTGGLLAFVGNAVGLGQYFNPQGSGSTTVDAAYSIASYSDIVAAPQETASLLGGALPSLDMP